MIEICGDYSSNVNRRRDGQMAWCWCAAGTSEASRQFRRVNGHLHVPTLRVAIDKHATADVIPTCETDHQAA